MYIKYNKWLTSIQSQKYIDKNNLVQTFTTLSKGDQRHLSHTELRGRCVYFMAARPVKLIESKC